MSFWQNYSEPVGYSSLVMPNAPLIGEGPPPPASTPTKSSLTKGNGQSAQRPTSLSVSEASRKISAVNSSPKKTSINNKVNELTHISAIDFPADEDADDVLRKENNELKLKIDYCWSHMSDQLDVLQKILAKEPMAHDDEAMVALAELKKCRDILKGTLKFSPTD